MIFCGGTHHEATSNSIPTLPPKICQKQKDADGKSDPEKNISLLMVVKKKNQMNAMPVTKITQRTNLSRKDSGIFHGLVFPRAFLKKTLSI